MENSNRKWGIDEETPPVAGSPCSGVASRVPWARQTDPETNFPGDVVWGRTKRPFPELFPAFFYYHPMGGVHNRPDGRRFGKWRTAMTIAEEVREAVRENRLFPGSSGTRDIKAPCRCEFQGSLSTRKTLV